MQTFRKIHIGRNIERLREFKGIKQEVLASGLGVSQQTISRIEQSETVDEVKLEQIAKLLGVTKEAIKNYSDEAVIFHIQTMNDNASANYQYNSNSVERIVELYERLLNEKNELIKQKDEVIKHKDAVIEMFKQQQKAS
ncbi:helix-turn-helix domain-containing protein [Mucilaginibacter paludis]|uniref:Helix-turn-helix domain protein n=1 Tax=Mucilaginibacter paludis DSM 18603 TaxID=714943 RepID=H1YDX3_9SPHI|nr:helix-turn-helix transcriptional regulator [Mucilaginibacter paludis]EHQ24313.1 helix-turn-helix domain protein [Mucilaginibacter paludis DSM 18603]